MTKKLFISYSDYNKDKKDILKSRIEKSKFLDPIVIAEHDENMKLLSVKIREGIDKADYLMPILTEESIKTQWVNQEIGYAKCKEKDRLIEIIPIVARNLLNNKDLKGFIHSQLDLPNHFDSSDTISFEKVVNRLISKIEDELNKREKLAKFTDDPRRFKKEGNLLYQFPDKQTRELYGYSENDVNEINKSEEINYQIIRGNIPSIKKVSVVKYKGQYYTDFNKELKLIPDKSTLQYIQEWNKNNIIEITKLSDDYKIGIPLSSYKKINK